MIITRRKRFFRGTLANFCTSKKCIIFNVDYRPGSKKSKFQASGEYEEPEKLVKPVMKESDVLAEGLVSIMNNNIVVRLLIDKYR